MTAISLDTARGAEIEQLLPAEQSRVRELQLHGQLDALYVPDGIGAPANLWAVFVADSRDGLQAILESLPLYPYMQLEITPLRSLQGGGR